MKKLLLTSMLCSLILGNSYASQVLVDDKDDKKYLQTIKVFPKSFNLHENKVTSVISKVEDLDFLELELANKDFTLLYKDGNKVKISKTQINGFEWKIPNDCIESYLRNSIIYLKKDEIDDIYNIQVFQPLRGGGGIFGKSSKDKSPDYLKGYNMGYLGAPLSTVSDDYLNGYNEGKRDRSTDLNLSKGGKIASTVGRVTTLASIPLGVGGITAIVNGVTNTVDGGLDIADGKKLSGGLKIVAGVTTTGMGLGGGGLLENQAVVKGIEGVGKTFTVLNGTYNVGEGIYTIKNGDVKNGVLKIFHGVGNIGSGVSGLGNNETEAYTNIIGGGLNSFGNGVYALGNGYNVIEGIYKVSAVKTEYTVDDLCKIVDDMCNVAEGGCYSYKGFNDTKKGLEQLEAIKSKNGGGVSGPGNQPKEELDKENEEQSKDNKEKVDEDKKELVEDGQEDVPNKKDTINEQEETQTNNKKIHLESLKDEINIEELKKSLNDFQGQIKDLKIQSTLTEDQKIEIANKIKGFSEVKTPSEAFLQLADVFEVALGSDNKMVENFRNVSKKIENCKNIYEESRYIYENMGQSNSVTVGKILKVTAETFDLIGHGKDVLYEVNIAGNSLTITKAGLARYIGNCLENLKDTELQIKSIMEQSRNDLICNNIIIKPDYSIQLKEIIDKASNDGLNQNEVNNLAKVANLLNELKNMTKEEMGKNISKVQDIVKTTPNVTKYVLEMVRDLPSEIVTKITEVIVDLSKWLASFFPQSRPIQLSNN